MDRKLIVLAMNILMLVCACDNDNTPISDNQADDDFQIHSNPVEDQDKECSDDTDCSSGYCAYSKCIPGLACRTDEVRCEEPAPSCTDGEVPTVIDSCWGNCVASSSCSNVDSCNSCAHNDLCIVTEFEISAHGPFKRYSCSTMPDNCSAIDTDCLKNFCPTGVFIGFENNILYCGAGGMYEPQE